MTIAIVTVTILLGLVFAYVCYVHAKLNAVTDLVETNANVYNENSERVTGAIREIQEVVNTNADISQDIIQKHNGLIDILTKSDDTSDRGPWPVAAPVDGGVS